jgi:hypothetical protein
VSELPWSTYTGTKLETADTAKERLQRTGPSSTRRDVRLRDYTGVEPSLEIYHQPRCSYSPR